MTIWKFVIFSHDGKIFEPFYEDLKSLAIKVLDKNRFANHSKTEDYNVTTPIRMDSMFSN